MIGGFYVVALQPFEGIERLGLLAGPFSTWAEADKVGPAAVADVKKMKHGNQELEFGIAQFYFHRQVDGSRNGPLWVKPSPIKGPG